MHGSNNKAKQNICDVIKTNIQAFRFKYGYQNQKFNKTAVIFLFCINKYDMKLVSGKVSLPEGHYKLIYAHAAAVTPTSSKWSLIIFFPLYVQSGRKCYVFS